ncbi:sensor histidine kinase [Paenibacillus cisolokensis]|uniref:sensor histidine kinase n=1 Tax=Paenibacillus cisolokensis TaxID=1658519 RepID=UPI003D294B64
MSQSLSILRYGMILLPAIAAIYLNPLEHYGEYMVYVLLFLAIAVLSRYLPGEASLKAALLLEIALSWWLCRNYGIMMAFLSVSSLCAYLPLFTRTYGWSLAALHLVLINHALMDSEPLIRTSANFLFVLVLVSVSLILEGMRKQEHTLRLYDELKQDHYRQDEAGKRLLHFAHQVESAAQTAERTRISRQLHDDIGHRLIRVKMMTEAAIQVTPGDPAKGMEMLHQIRDQLSQSMEEMRAAVKRVNPRRSLSDDYALDRLLEETEKETGIDTNLRLQGLPYPLYPSQHVVLYRNAKEAITNAIRHGGASQVNIVIHYGEEHVRMEVSNNGETGDHAASSSSPMEQGMGIRGMRERTELIGGLLEIRRTPVFTVITQLPVYRTTDMV